MKKILIIGIVLFMLVGCGNDRQRVDTELDNTTYATVCVDGVKIWVMKYHTGNKSGLTSQIIGVCENE